MLKYEKHFRDGSGSFDITYEEALKAVIGAFGNCDWSRDLLTMPNNIRTKDFYVYVSEVHDGTETVLMAGLYNLSPMGFRYDKDGNRIA